MQLERQHLCITSSQQKQNNANNTTDKKSNNSRHGCSSSGSDFSRPQQSVSGNCDDRKQLTLLLPDSPPQTCCDKIRFIDHPIVNDKAHTNSCHYSLHRDDIGKSQKASNSDEQNEIGGFDKIEKQIFNECSSSSKCSVVHTRKPYLKTLATTFHSSKTGGYIQERVNFHFSLKF